MATVAEGSVSPCSSPLGIDKHDDVVKKDMTRVTIHDQYHCVLSAMIAASQNYACSLCREGETHTITEQCLALLYMWGQGLDLNYLENHVELDSCLQETVISHLEDIARVIISDLFSLTEDTLTEYITLKAISQANDNDASSSEDDESESNDDEISSTSSRSAHHYMHPRTIRKLKNRIDGLMVLLPTIRSSCNVENLRVIEEQNEHPIESQVSAAARPYVAQVHDKFTTIKNSLADRLGQANWDRSYRLRKMAMRIADSSKSDESAYQSARSNFNPTSEFQDSGLGASLPAASSYAASVVSNKSYLSTASAANRGTLRVPSTPIEIEMKLPFSCPVCGKKQRQLRNRIDWKKHVFSDIQPYICTIGGGNKCSKTFPSRDLWAKHELEEHRHLEMYSCFPCSIEFEDPDEFLRHVGDAHGISNESRGGNRAALLSTARTSLVPAPQSLVCPMCQRGGFPSRREYTNHVGRHMEEIALIALPQMDDSDEEASADDDDLSSSDLEPKKLSLPEGLNPLHNEFKVQQYIIQSLNQDGPFQGWQAEVPIAERAQQVKLLVDSIRLLGFGAVNVSRAVDVTLNFERKEFSQQPSREDYHRECADKLSKIRDRCQQITSQQVPQQHLQRPPLTMEDNSIINQRAAELARHTPKEEIHRTIETMDPVLKKNCTTKGIDPIAYHFRMVATREFRARQMQGGRS